jgi:hypothetical protein
MQIVYNKFMSKAKSASIPKLPSLNFGKKPLGFVGGAKTPQPKSFVPITFRVTQHKGGGGK